MRIFVYSTLDEYASGLRKLKLTKATVSGKRRFIYSLFRSCRKSKLLCFKKLKNHLLRLLIFSQRRFPFFVDVPVYLLQYTMACQGHSIDALRWSDCLFFVCYTTFKGNLCIPCSTSLFCG